MAVHADPTPALMNLASRHGLRHRFCSSHHFQIIDSNKNVLLDAWPSQRKFRRGSVGPRTKATVGNFSDMEAALLEELQASKETPAAPTLRLRDQFAVALSSGILAGGNMPTPSAIPMYADLVYELAEALEKRSNQRVED